MLSRVPGVRGFTSETDEERDLTTLQVVVESDEAARAAEEAVRKDGLKVAASWRKQATLEEVFVALVGQGFKEREEGDVA